MGREKQAKEEDRRKKSKIRNTGMMEWWKNGGMGRTRKQ
jgi:hypothetical protein